MTLVRIEGLGVRFSTRSECVQAVDTVDLDIARGDHIALIGESGCGKTVLGMAVMGLLPKNAWITGAVRYRDQDLLKAAEPDLQRIRGKEIAMIMQNSALSLNPVKKVGDQIAEPLLIHHVLAEKAAHDEIVRLLTAMGFDEPERAAGRYPHEFSGGMRERILVAVALACKPDIVIADEPTSGLDAGVKSRILALIKQQMADRTLFLITHDMGTAHYLCTQIAVMYAGEIVETGRTHDLLSLPMHPYTQGLLASLPSAGLHPIPGMSPSPTHLPGGCRFCARCPASIERCSREHPPLISTGERLVRCFLYD
ncbi:MAG TPA: ABC transporter ATP-binding protein [Methanoregula sp.]|mgnify:CR=1 FL=1|nr:ABC transporter ATP-binding protein [Methanoregula sp.]